MLQSFGNYLAKTFYFSSDCPEKVRILNGDLRKTETWVLLHQFYRRRSWQKRETKIIHPFISAQQKHGTTLVSSFLTMFSRILDT